MNDYTLNELIRQRDELNREIESRKKEYRCGLFKVSQRYDRKEGKNVYVFRKALRGDRNGKHWEGVFTTKTLGEMEQKIEGIITDATGVLNSIKARQQAFSNNGEEVTP